MHWKSAAAVVSLLPILAGCGDDEGTNPTRDEAPEVMIVDAPFSATVGETVEVLYRATDDRELTLISVSWGTLDAPVELVFPSGTDFEDLATHAYSEADSYLVTVTATDSEGQTGRDMVEIDVEP